MDIQKILAEKIAGEITLSPRPGETIRKWRNNFNITQTELAKHLKLSPSVISDYESGRRKSPGIQTIKKIIDALIEIDKDHGETTIHKFDTMAQTQDGIIEIMEYPFTLKAKDFIEKIEANLVTSKKTVQQKNIKGFTLVDSLKTIKNINSSDYSRLYGWSIERAIIFTGIQYGRSPMIAIRVHPVKPSTVVYHRPGAVDPLAVKLAEKESIPLAVTNMPLNKLKIRLISIGEE